MDPTKMTKEQYDAKISATKALVDAAEEQLRAVGTRMALVLALDESNGLVMSFIGDGIRPYELLGLVESFRDQLSTDMVRSNIEWRRHLARQEPEKKEP